MEGKTVQVELSGNALEATGITGFEYNGNELIIYSLGEDYRSNGNVYDKLYVSYTGPKEMKIGDDWSEIQKLVFDMGEPTSTLTSYKLHPLNEEVYKVYEPKKLATPKYICREIAKKIKKIEEEEKMNQENQAQSTGMFVDPSLIGTGEPTVTETTQEVAPSVNAFDMSLPDQNANITNVAPTPEATAPTTPVTTEVQAAPQEARPAPAPVEPTIPTVTEVAPTYVETPVITQPTVAPEYVAPAPQEATPAPVQPTIPTVAEVAPTFVEQVSPVQETQFVAPAATVENNDINDRFISLVNELYDLVKNNNITITPKEEVVNTIADATVEAPAPVVEVQAAPAPTAENINLNSMPILNQEVQTETLGQDREFTGNTGQIPVVNPETNTVVTQETTVAPVPQEQVTPQTYESPQYIPEEQAGPTIDYNVNVAPTPEAPAPAPEAPAPSNPEAQPANTELGMNFDPNVVVPPTTGTGFNPDQNNGLEKTLSLAA